MCTDCNEITIPQGPTGDTGATGATGATGIAGAPGLDGTNGTTILATYNSLTGVGTPASLLETSLFNYNMPANTLNVNGDELELYVYYLYNATDSTTLRVKLGAKIVTINKTNAQNLGMFLKINISRISSTSQQWVIEETSIDALGVKTISVMSVDSSTVDLTTILAVEITGQNNTTAVTNQLVLKKATAYKYAV